MKQSSKRFTSTIIALVFILGALTVFFNFIQPTYADLNNLRGDLAARQQFAENQAHVVAEAKKLIESFRNGADAREALSLAFPATPDIAGVVGQVNGILNINGLTPNIYSISVKSQGQRPATGFGQQPGNAFTVAPIGTVVVKAQNVVGKYENIKKFLETLETNIRIMDTTKIDFDLADPTKKTQNQYKMTVEVNAHYQAPKNTSN